MRRSLVIFALFALTFAAGLVIGYRVGWKDHEMEARYPLIFEAYHRQGSRAP